MKKEIIQGKAITLVGLTVRTNNQNEMNPEASKIAELAALYWGSQVAHAIQNRSRPGVTYAVYTEFENNEQGEYTYFIGEAVDSLQNQNLEQFKAITIPAGDYTKFTTEPGKIPDVVIAAWQKIWAMKEDDFGGRRRYLSDFEVYDERAADPNKASLDIYIGIDRLNS